MSSPPLRVLFDYAAFTMQRAGGVSRVFFELARYLADRDDVACRIVAPLHKNEFLSQKRALPPGVHRGLRLPAPLDRKLLLNAVDRPAFIWEAARFRPHIAHYSFYETPRVPPQTRVVVTVHDMIADLFPETLGSRNRQRSDRRAALDRADGIICVSEQTRNDLANHYDLASRAVTVIHNGVGLEAGDLSAEQAPALPEPYLLYVGDRQTTYKNFGLLLTALAEDRRLDRFHLVCFGSQSFTRTERAQFAELGLTDRIMHCGGDDAVLAHCYRNAFALVYCSRYEGFGIPPIEAMSHHCPVVLSNAPPLPEIAGPAAAYFDARSSSALAAAVVSLIDPDHRARLIAAGRAHAQRYAWQRMGQETLAFYRTLLA